VHSPSNEHQRTFVAQEYEGRPVAAIHDAHGNKIIMSVGPAEDFVRYGYSTNIFPRRNGGGAVYPCIKIMTPDPTASQDSDLLVARYVAARQIITNERITGEQARAKGWVVKFVNGNPLDLRDENILIRSAEGRRNGFLAMWDLTERIKLVERGLNPNTVFIERRRLNRKRGE